MTFARIQIVSRGRCHVYRFDKFHFFWTTQMKEAVGSIETLISICQRRKKTAMSVYCRVNLCSDKDVFTSRFDVTDTQLLQNMKYDTVNSYVILAST
jgi:hypothetical protein